MFNISCDSVDAIATCGIWHSWDGLFISGYVGRDEEEHSNHEIDNWVDGAHTRFHAAEGSSGY